MWAFLIFWDVWVNLRVYFFCLFQVRATGITPCYHPRRDKHSFLANRLQVRRLIIETVAEFLLRTRIALRLPRVLTHLKFIVSKLDLYRV